MTNGSQVWLPYERALALDPNLIAAAGNLISNRVELGEGGKAYDAARALVKTRPQSGLAHSTLAFVLKNAGMLEEAGRECDTALALDPGNYQFRFCTWVFQELDKPERAMDFIRLDAGSEYANYALASLLLREGKIAEAQEAAKKMGSNPLYHRDLLEACLYLRSPSELNRMAREVEDNPPHQRPENLYLQAGILAFCGKREAAVHLLQTAIGMGYCANSALRSDPLLVKLRGTPEFSQLLSIAKECQNRFLAERNPSSR